MPNLMPHLMQLQWLWPADTVPGDQEPKAWGRYFWTALHAAAAAAEAEPSLKPRAVDLIRTLRDVLPCTACRKSIRATLSQSPPDPQGDVGAWLRDLEIAVSARRLLQEAGDAAGAGGLSARARAPRAERWERAPLEAGEVELAWMLAYALRGAGGRSMAVIAKWFASFDEFLRAMAELLDPPPTSLLRIMAATDARGVRYDPYRYLEYCLRAQALVVRAAVRAARADRPADDRPRTTLRALPAPAPPPAPTPKPPPKPPPNRAAPPRRAPALPAQALRRPERPALPRAAAPPSATPITTVAHRTGVQQRLWRMRHPRSGAGH